jgi:hypothetical protein
VGLSPAEQAALRQLDGGAASADNADLQRLAALAAAQRITPDERQQLARLQQAEAARAAERLARLDGALALLQRQAAAAPRTALAVAAASRPAAMMAMRVHSRSASSMALVPPPMASSLPSSAPPLAPAAAAFAFRFFFFGGFVGRLAAMVRSACIVTKVQSQSRNYN